MKNYKKSQFNLSGRMEDGNYLVYNTLSSSVAILDRQEAEALEKGVFEENDFLEGCRQLGFVVESSECELEKVIALRNMNNFNTRRAGFQILPTTGCNAKCFYCYEEDFCTETMTDERVEEVISFLKNYLLIFDEVSVAWFGGEPLTRFDVIERISKELIPYLDENHIAYNSNMITNAALLSDEIIGKMLEYRITDVQITLDGYGEEHDKRKRYASSQVNYDTIIQNIKKLVDARIKVLVRLNIDKYNIDGCLKAVEDLAKTVGTSEYIWLYFAPLYSDKGYEGCLKKEELADVFKKAYKTLIDTGYIQTINGLAMNFTNASCCAQGINNFVISPNGKISKCEHLLGDERDVVGSVTEGISFNKAMAYWSKSAIPVECETCAYLPMCQTGCNAAEIRGFGYGRCSYIRYINEATVYAAEYLLKKEGGK